MYCDFLPLAQEIESRLSSKRSILESETIVLLLAAFMVLLLAQAFYVTSVAFAVSLFVACYQ